MKRLILPSLCLAAASLCLAAASRCVAQATIKSSSSGVYGVSYSRIESTDLTDAEIKGLRTTATADVTASASNINASVNHPVMVRSSHTACFSTVLTTEADYQFVLDVGGRQTVVSEHLVIPNRQRTCVTKELYQQVTFPTTGQYRYSATSSGTTQMAGRKEIHSDAYVFVS